MPRPATPPELDHDTALATTPAAARPRVVALDVVRGVALCGILLVNIEPVTEFRYEVEHGPATLADASGWLQLLVQQRFFPIFSLLFGVGAALFLESASQRAARPRVLLLRRLLVLLPVGVLHQLVHPGEALAVYAVVGLVVLLPSTWLPRWAVAVGAAVAVPAALAVGGGLVLVPGMFLLGSALARYGVVDRVAAVDRSPGAWRAPLPRFAGFAAASGLALVWQLRDVAGSGFTAASAVAGLLMAGAYASGVVVLLATPARAALVVLFAPLGRTALTGYLLATPLMLGAGHLLDLPHSSSWGLVLGVAAVVLVAQWVAAVLWLRSFRQGPLEWLWRWATWGQRAPLRRAA